MTQGAQPSLWFHLRFPPLPFFTSKDMRGGKRGHDEKKQSYAAPMQPPSVPEQPKKLATEPTGEAKGYDEIRARIGKGKKRWATMFYAPSRNRGAT